MVNPGAFRGSRKAFLVSKKAEYNAAVVGHYVPDALAKIQRQYLKRYPMDLPHNQEPDEAFLQAVDDDAADPEPEEPNAEMMSEDEYKAAVEALKIRKFNLEYRKKQIRRWFSYQYIKDNNVRSKETGNYMPYAALIQKLTGKDVVRPRLKTPVNVWRKGQDQRDLIEKHLKAEVELERRLGNNIPSTQYAAIRDRIAREIFADLDEATRREAREKAAAEHRIALEKYKEDICDNPSTDPADRQMAIQGLIPFFQPALDMVCDFTGWKLSLFGGGPEPAQGGRLSVISIHSGHTSGAVKMTYGRAERAYIKKHVITSFGRFLKLCYTPEECRARALGEDDDGFLPMSAYENDTDETSYHTIEETGKSNNDSPPPCTATPSTPLPITSTRTPSAEDRNDQATASIEPTAPQASAIVSTRDHDRYTTQDAMPSDANPFPFDDLDDLNDLNDLGEDETPDSVSHTRSPLPSAVPSPAGSRAASPAPVSTTQHLEDATLMKDSVVEAATVTRPANASSSPAPTNVICQPIAPSTTALPKKTPSTKALKSRKSPPEAPVAVEGPPSKRSRTKTMRAIASEEQNKTRGRGKENSSAGSGGKSSGKGKRV